MRGWLSMGGHQGNILRCIVYFFYEYLYMLMNSIYNQKGEVIFRFMSCYHGNKVKKSNCPCIFSLGKSLKTFYLVSMSSFCLSKCGKFGCRDVLLISDFVTLSQREVSKVPSLLPAPHANTVPRFLKLHTLKIQPFFSSSRLSICSSLSKSSSLFSTYSCRSDPIKPMHFSAPIHLSGS